MLKSVQLLRVSFFRSEILSKLVLYTVNQCQQWACDSIVTQGKLDIWNMFTLYQNIIDGKLSLILFFKILRKIFGRNSITHIMASRKATHNKRGVMSLLPDHQHHCRRVRDKYSRLDLANESFLFRQSFWLSNYSLTSNNIFVRKWFWPTLRFLFIFIEKNFINWKN